MIVYNIVAYRKKNNANKFFSEHTDTVPIQFVVVSDSNQRNSNTVYIRAGMIGGIPIPQVLTYQEFQELYSLSILEFRRIE